MKVLIVNGSPHAKGNTAIALGKEQYGLPETEDRVVTNFVR